MLGSALQLLAACFISSRYSTPSLSRYSSCPFGTLVPSGYNRVRSPRDPYVNFAYWADWVAAQIGFP